MVSGVVRLPKGECDLLSKPLTHAVVLPLAIVSSLICPAEKLAWAAMPAETVVLSGQSGRMGPGIPGAAFSKFNIPYLNAAGQILISGEVEGPSVTAATSKGFWMCSHGKVRLIARAGDPAPGVSPGILLGSLRSCEINDAGHVLLSGVLSGPGIGPNIEGIWTGTVGSLGLRLLTGDPLPGSSSGMTIRQLFCYSLNSTDAMPVECVEQDSPWWITHWSIWRQDATSFTRIAEAGQPAPGAGQSVLFTNDMRQPGISLNGEIGFRAALTGTGVTSANDFGIWVTNGGTLGLIAREGFQAPGMPAGAKFVNLAIYEQFVMDDEGEAFFASQVSGGGVATGTDYGLWIAKAGAVSLATRAGEPIPGAPSLKYGSISPESLACNGNGILSFSGRIAGDGVTANNQRALFRGPAGNIRPIVRQGDELADAPGVFQSGIMYYTAINNSEQTAFWNELTGSGVTTLNNEAVFASTPSRMKLIVRKGDELLCGDGVTRTITSILFGGSHGPPSGQSAGLANNGWLTYAAEFSDGTSGVFRVRVTCNSDFNNDDLVDDADFSLFVAAYDILDCEDPVMLIGCPADLDSNWLVDDADFSLFVVAYNDLLCP